MSSVYEMNFTGPRTDPCGTPQVRTDHPVDALTSWVRSVRYNVNQSSAPSWTLNLSFSIVNKVAWSTVSNAALRSNIARAQTLSESTARKISSRMLTTVVSVECRGLYADWWTGSRRYAVACSWKRFIFIYLKSTWHRAGSATCMPHSQQRHAYKSDTHKVRRNFKTKYNDNKKITISIWYVYRGWRYPKNFWTTIMTQN